MGPETGYVYLLAVTDLAVIADICLRHPFCTGFETSKDGKLGWLRVGADIGKAPVPKGTAVRVPSVLGGRIARGPDWETIGAEQFYSLGPEPLDGYALADEVLRLEAELAAAKAALAKATAKAVVVTSGSGTGGAPDESSPAYSCPHCEKVCGSEIGLQSHVRAKHPEA